MAPRGGEAPGDLQLFRTEERTNYIYFSKTTTGEWEGPQGNARKKKRKRVFLSLYEKKEWSIDGNRLEERFTIAKSSGESHPRKMINSCSGKSGLN